MLLLQDIKFLVIIPNRAAPDGAGHVQFNWVVGLHFGVTLPLYLCAALFMYVLGKYFYEKWLIEAEEAKSKALNEEFKLEIENEMDGQARV